MKPMRPPCRFLVPLWLAGAAFALGQPGFAREEARAPVEMLTPRHGATLVAGSAAELEWRAAGSFDRFPQVEEWEAFLSLDGGATYPVRITPHLDQDLRRIRWQVPPVATPDARILLRFGDEHKETAVELPARFAIAASPAVETGFLLARLAATEGEAALPGKNGVAAWMEGSRRGGGLRQVVAAGPASGQGSFPPRRAMTTPFSPPSPTHRSLQLPCPEAVPRRLALQAAVRCAVGTQPSHLSLSTSCS